MTTQEVNELWEKYGNAAWIKCIPQIKEILNNLPLSEDIPLEQAQAIVRCASIATARAYRLGFKIGSCVSEQTSRRVKLITSLS